MREMLSGTAQAPAQLDDAGADGKCVLSRTGSARKVYSGEKDLNVIHPGLAPKF